MKIDDHKDKKRFEISICEGCASSKTGLIQIFRLKRGKSRQAIPCEVCNQPTNALFKGIADSEAECNHIANKLKK